MEEKIDQILGHFFKWFTKHQLIIMMVSGLGILLGTGFIFITGYVWIQYHSVHVMRDACLLGMLCTFVLWSVFHMIYLSWKDPVEF